MAAQCQGNHCDPTNADAPTVADRSARRTDRRRSTALVELRQPMQLQLRFTDYQQNGKAAKNPPLGRERF